MSTHSFKVISILFFWIFFNSCTFEKEDRTWDAFTVGIPEKINPDAATINMGLYILKQTHEPILRLDSNGQYYSDILLSWKKSVDGKNYQFCPNEKKLFSDKINFNVYFLESFFEKYLSKNDFKGDVGIESGCVSVSLKKFSEKFIRNLTYYENAPSVPSANPKWEDGLGYYRVGGITPTEVTLKRKDDNKNGYTEIHFSNYNGPKDQALKRKDVEDFNRVLVPDIPVHVKKEYASYGLSILQTVNLIINHHDPKVREALYNCIDIEGFRRSFMVGQQKFSDIGTIIPVGIPGAKKSRIVQSCSPLKNLTTVTFVNWNKENSESLTKYFEGLKLKTNIDVRIRNVTLSEFVNMVVKRPHPYHLTVVALDATRAEFEPFYELFVDPKTNLVDLELPQLQKSWKDFLKKIEQVFNISNVDDLNKALDKERVALPLYQEVRDFFYPKKITRMKTGDDFLEYPEIGKITL